jgi:hypothetical protein
MEKLRTFEESVNCQLEEKDKAIELLKDCVRIKDI